MLALVSTARTFAALLSSTLVVLSMCPGAPAQRPAPGRGAPMPGLPSPTRLPGQQSQTSSVTVSISVRDPQGVPLETAASVHLYSPSGSYNVTAMTREVSSAVFSNVAAGNYQVEVRSDGYQTATEQVSVAGFGSELSVYVYLHPESERLPANQPARGVVMTPQLQSTIDKGLEAMRRRDCEAARAQFEKGVKLAPANADLIYLLGTSESCLGHWDLARKDFEWAANLNPSHEKALMALGELQLGAGETDAAVATLEKAFQLNGADWRTHLLLAMAYTKVGRLADAESHARRAANLAGEKGTAAVKLLGEIQEAERKQDHTGKTSEQVVAKLLDVPLISEGNRDGAASPGNAPEKATNRTASQSAPQRLADLPPPVLGVPWAPPDIDCKEYLIAPDVSCGTGEILERALARLNTQLQNFEKFTATERIEHQEIDRSGMPGAVKSHEFSYIVFVKSYRDSVYLEESRDGGENLASFPTSLATTGLNSLGVSLLQPANQANFLFQCEGLTNVRGEAAWQMRFEENKNSPAGVRQWKKNGVVYKIPLKGRIWIAAASYDLLRVETDLIEPIERLQLTRDHLRVEYGPVKFDRGSETLWLPWNADMFLELHGKRYHHRHYLSDYMLFEVDTANKIGKPKEKPALEGESSP